MAVKITLSSTPASDNEERVSLATIIDDALRSISVHQLRVVLVPRFKSTTPAFALLRMILHALTTNALRYGDLSRANGVVLLSGSTVGDGNVKSLHLDWQEEKGPRFSPIVWGLARK
ncbi:hypothetical protein [Methylocystis echinoides]|uniref:hypothetical protein n=1 Tax=Methylocystis echinoides TaxID=29468 RepID=UPI00344ACE4B